MPNPSKIEIAKQVLLTGTTQEKIQYFWDYYKWYALTVIICVIAVVNIVYTNATAKDCILDGIFLNANNYEEQIDHLAQEFLSAQKIDPASNEVIFECMKYAVNPNDGDLSASYNSLEIIVAKVAAEELDILAGDVGLLTRFASNQYFLDLSSILTTDQVQIFEPYFLYADMSAISNSDHYSDPRKPELMDEPVPLFIDISAYARQHAISVEMNDRYAIGIIANSSNINYASEFLQWVINQQH